jgi:hypothetical protein
MFKKTTSLILALGLLFFLIGCGLREKVPGERFLPEDGMEMDKPASDEEGSENKTGLPGEEEEDALLLEELEQEIDELLNLLDELDELEESDLEF